MVIATKPLTQQAGILINWRWNNSFWLLSLHRNYQRQLLKLIWIYWI